MKKPYRLILMSVFAAAFLTSTASAAPGGPKAGRTAAMPPVLSYATARADAVSAPLYTPAAWYTTSASDQFTDLSAEELWNQFAQAEAYKKLYEFQEKAVHEKLKLLEGPGAFAFYSATDGDPSGIYAQLLDLQKQQYLLKTQKEQYEWQKKQAESYLKLTGAKLGKAELQYALYTGQIAASGLDYDELYAQQYSLRLQEEQQELVKKNLECQYQLGQITEDEFVRQYTDAVRQKETAKMQREQYEAELQTMFGIPGLPIRP